MLRNRWMQGAVAAAVALGGAAVLAQGSQTPGQTQQAAQQPQSAAASQMAMVRPDQVQWGQAPPLLPKGGQMAVLSGDPATPGKYFAVRLKAPTRYTVPPHTHPTDEVITVMTGTFHAGMGRTLDQSAAQTYPAGSFVVMPAGMAHYAWLDAGTVIQIQGMGPFQINYINPADDPRNQGVGGAGSQGTDTGTQSTGTQTPDTGPQSTGPQSTGK